MSWDPIAVTKAAGSGLCFHDTWPAPQGRLHTSQRRTKRRRQRRLCQRSFWCQRRHWPSDGNRPDATADRAPCRVDDDSRPSRGDFYNIIEPYLVWAGPGRHAGRVCTQAEVGRLTRARLGFGPPGPRRPGGSNGTVGSRTGDCQLVRVSSVSIQGGGQSPLTKFDGKRGRPLGWSSPRVWPAPQESD